MGNVRVITPAFVRSLFEPKGYTYQQAAASIGISARAMRRYITNGAGWRQPPIPTLLALKTLQKKRGPR